MDVSISAKRFLQNRRDRVVGSILGYAESELKPQLTPAQWESLRQTVISSVNSYHDTVLDLVKSDDATRNDHLISLLERVDAKLQTQQRSVTRPVPTL